MNDCGYKNSFARNTVIIVSLLLAFLLILLYCRAFLAIKPFRHLLKLFLIKNHLSEGAISAQLASNSLWLIIKIYRLKLAHGAVLAISMLILRHSFGTLIAGDSLRCR